MSSKRKVRGLSSGKEKPDELDAEESSPRNSGKEVKIPGIHRLGAADLETHFGEDNKPNTAAENSEEPSKRLDSTEPKLSGNIPENVDIQLSIEKKLWRQVQIAAADKGIDPSRYVEMALEAVLNSEK
ncbi:MAG TPA: hypothetical protein PKD26_16905 [Pyrinomonadaceae bacterium]|nr:hypothetical protein [Pyrinomonadaceae bacterium]